MKILGGFLFIVLSVLVSSCAVGGLSGGSGSGPGLTSGVDTFSIANEIVKGSLLVVGMGTNDLDKGLSFYGLPAVKGVGKIMTNWIDTNSPFTVKHYIFSGAAWGGKGSIEADLTLSNLVRLMVITPPESISTNTNISFVIGSAQFNGYQVGKMTDPCSGSLLCSLTILNDLTAGTKSQTITMDGGLTNGSGIIQVHFESTTVIDGTGTGLTTFSNCLVNGSSWLPDLN
jgi:hypothetical protein